MGAAQSTDLLKQKKAAYIPMERKKVFDDRMGEVMIARDRESDRLVWMKEHDVTFEEKLALVKYFDTVKQDENYFKIFTTLDFLAVNTQSQLAYCSHPTWTILVVGLHVDKTLEEEIQQRAVLDISSGGYFSENEIWLVIQAIQDAESHYAKSNRLHGDIRLRNILVLEDGSIKFVDSYLCHWKSWAMHRAILEGTKVPLAAEVMEKVRADEASDMPTSPNEVWSIGIVVLCMATLRTEKEFYDWNKKRIRTDVIKQALLEVPTRYSSRIQDLLVGCLQEVPENRISMYKFLTAAALSGSVL